MPKGNYSKTLIAFVTQTIIFYPSLKNGHISILPSRVIEKN